MRLIVTDKNPRALGNGTLKPGDEIELTDSEAMVMRALGLAVDPPVLMQRRQPRRPSGPAPEPSVAAPEAVIAPQVKVQTDADVIRAEPQPELPQQERPGEPQPDRLDSSYHRRDMRPEE